MEVEISLSRPHENQLRILQNRKRFNHVKCGRRFGKTQLVKLLASYALDGKFIGIWFPTYKDLADVWRELIITFYPAIQKKDEQLKQIILMNGGILDFWSMDDPDSGRGRKYHRAIIDEGAKAKRFSEAWKGTIRPTLTDYKGDAWFFSTPKGKNNSFFKLSEDMKDQPDWAFFHFTSYDNPYLDKTEIEDAKHQLDDLTFRQEYLAEDVDANDRPFMYAYLESDHVIDSYELNPNVPIIVSYDFNKDPMTAVISQSTSIRHLRIFDEIKLPNGSTPELCDLISARYNKWIGRIVVTGDASGNNRSPLVKGGLNHYIIIKKQLMIRDNQFRVRKSNLSHVNSRILCNSVLQNADFKITKNCKETISDMVYGAVDENGSLLKSPERGLHFLDNVRYTIDAVFPDFITNPKKYA